MVETNDFKDAAGDLKSAAHAGLVAVEQTTVRGFSGVGQSTLKSLGENIGALGIGAGVTAGITQWDYVHERDTIRKQYEAELSAQTGKPYNDVTNKDLDAMGKKNAVIADALKRARWKRNLGLVVGTVAVVAAFAVAGILTGGAGTGFVGLLGGLGLGAVPASFTEAFALATPAIESGLFLAKALFSGAVAVATFMGTEAAAHAVADRTLGLKEPSIRKVTKNPDLQDKLSLSSQVNYIQHLQKRINTRKPETFISQEQVFKVLLAANSGMAGHIESAYGSKFSALSPQQRVLAMDEISQSIGLNLEKFTSDLNNRQVRAQELAFIVQGESSGVPRHDTPRTSALEKAQIQIEQKLAQAQQEITHLKQQMKTKTTQLGGAIKNGTSVAMDKMGFGKKEDASAEQSPGAHAQRELARRQQTAAQQPVVGA